MRKSLIFLFLLSLFISLPLPYLMPRVGQADFIAYWSSASLLVNGKDPYNVSEITELQINQFPDRKTEEGNYVIIAWNPPWLNLLFIPFGIFPFEIASHIWLFINIFLIGAGVLLAWDLSTRPFDSRGFIYVLAISLFFIEVLISLIIGQITSIILASLVFGFWLLKKEYDWQAGIVLAFTLIKPHLVYFPLFLLFIWIIRFHKWKVLLGIVSVMLLSGIVMWIFNPNWLTGYLSLLGNLPNYQDTAGTIGNFFRTIFNTKIFDYAFLATIPLAIPFTNILGESLDFTPFNAAILISIFLAPYGFGVDQLLAVPMIVQLYSWIRKKRVSKLSKSIYLIIYISTNVLIIIFLLFDLPVYWGFWFPLAYLLLFLYGWHMDQKSSAGLTL